MSLLGSYRLRVRRQRLLARAFLRRRDLKPVVNRMAGVRAEPMLLFACLRNEKVRLPYFLQYYRDLGVDHFLIVDNDSDDGSREYLARQPDVSLWTTKASYKRARFGMDWLTHLQRRYGHDCWCLTVDVDEFLIYPFCETRPLRALTDWLDASQIRTFSSMLLDMYPKGPVQDQPYREGQNPFEIAQWFDSGNYTLARNWGFGNLWIQGGPRTRTFFEQEPKRAPALNKIPLVKWHRSYAYVSSTHMLLPRGLNLVFDEWGGEKASGCLLHAKFLDTFAVKAEEEMSRGEHYADSREYRAYQEALKDQPDMWCKWSEKYINWRQLEILGLMSKETGHEARRMSLGFVMLCHTALDRAAQVARYWATRDCPVVIHVDTRTPGPLADQLRVDLADLDNVRFLPVTPANGAHGESSPPRRPPAQ